jgi:hypothetical protein
MAVGDKSGVHVVQMGGRIYSLNDLDLLVREPGGQDRFTGISLRPLARLCYADAEQRAERKMGGG